MKYQIIAIPLISGGHMLLKTKAQIYDANMMRFSNDNFKYPISYLKFH